MNFDRLKILYKKERQIYENSRKGRAFFSNPVWNCRPAVLILSRTGISTDVVLSGSMEPGIRTGGLVFTDTRRRDPQTGDIITYRLRDVRITHRVVRREGTVLITKGDANEGEDPLPVEAEQVLGTVIFSIPFVGYLVTFMKQRTILAILTVMIGQEIFFFIQNELTERRIQYERRQEEKS